MSAGEETGRILSGLTSAGVEFIVVGGTPPTEPQLMGSGHINLQTDLGKLDVLCELSLGEGYEQVLPDTVLFEQGTHRVRVIGLERLIAVKTRAGRPKDRMVLPVLVATLEERRRRQP